MKARVLAAMLAASLFAPAHAFADDALAEARGAEETPRAFDGAHARQDASVAVAGDDGGPGGGRRRERRLERPEPRPASAVPIGADKEIEAPKSNGWLTQDHVIAGVSGALIGALIGSLWGWPGLLIGLGVGALIGYGISRLKA